MSTGQASEMTIHEKRHKMRRLLWSWGQTLEYIERKREEQRAFFSWADDAANTLKAQAVSDMPRGGKKSDMLDEIARVKKEREMYKEAARRVNDDIAERLELKRIIDEHVKALGAREQRVIELRYQGGHTSWRYIALKMCYDESAVRRIESTAVDKLIRNTGLL